MARRPDLGPAKRDLPSRVTVRADQAAHRSSDDPRPWWQGGSGGAVAGAGSARARQRDGRRLRAALIAPPREIVRAGRSRSRSARLRNRERDGDRQRHRGGHVLRPEQAEADNLLKAGSSLRWPTAFGARKQVRRRSGTKTQPAAWAANRGHNRPFPLKPERRVYALAHIEPVRSSSAGLARMEQSRQRGDLPHRNRKQLRGAALSAASPRSVGVGWPVVRSWRRCPRGGGRVQRNR
jgi:hypothetical protein